MWSFGVGNERLFAGYVGVEAGHGSSHSYGGSIIRGILAFVTCPHYACEAGRYCIMSLV